MFPDYDWHIGGALHVRKSYGEFGTFLNRLAVLIEDENIDMLPVAAAAA
jgi:DNA repair exonuclease SbcCD nuclease subunit